MECVHRPGRCGGGPCRRCVLRWRRNVVGAISYRRAPGRHRYRALSTHASRSDRRARCGGGCGLDRPRRRRLVSDPAPRCPTSATLVSASTERDRCFGDQGQEAHSRVDAGSRSHLGLSGRRRRLSLLALACWCDRADSVHCGRNGVPLHVSTGKPTPKTVDDRLGRAGGIGFGYLLAGRCTDIRPDRDRQANTEVSAQRRASTVLWSIGEAHIRSGSAELATTGERTLAVGIHEAGP